ncbi:hypothetical protein F5B21DRAFT_360802 [Xylaria acuta]|nr:hypothetical protein F5B21DRAFT_360802 [Xylaria acuta]
MTMPLKLNHLYVALQYPRDADVDIEKRPELLPTHLRTRTNGDRELEYTWSFVLTFELCGQMITQQYTLIKGAGPESDPAIMDRCIKNKHLLKRDYYIETFVRVPKELGSIPRLMILLEMQLIDMQSFDTFLANHNALANWPLFTFGNHATHLWARNVLIDYEAININDGTIMSVEEAARTSLREHLYLKPENHDWEALICNPLWQVHIYDANCPGHRRIGGE